MALSWPSKDPDAVLDYSVDWSAWLVLDTIATSIWVVPSGITKDSDTSTDTVTTIWLSGGTLNVSYEFVNRILTAGGRTNDQTVKIKIRAR